MASPEDRLPENISGRFYVDNTCIDCDQCRSTAPEFFRRSDDDSMSYVFRQPTTEDEVTLALSAMEGCPTESIGNDGM